MVQIFISLSATLYALGIFEIKFSNHDDDIEHTMNELMQTMHRISLSFSFVAFETFILGPHFN